MKVTTVTKNDLRVSKVSFSELNDVYLMLSVLNLLRLDVLFVVFFVPALSMCLYYFIFFSVGEKITNTGDNVERSPSRSSSEERKKHDDDEARAASLASEIEPNCGTEIGKIARLVSKKKRSTAPKSRRLALLRKTENRTT